LLDDEAFVFFTDGVYEAANERGEEFGLARMEEAIRDHMYKRAPVVVAGIREAVHAFVGDTPLSDDICVVAIEVTTKLREPAPDAAP